MTMTTMKSRGEQLFSEYLGALGRPFDYEPPIGQRQPDFIVHAPSGEVLCEVKDLEANDDDRAEMEAARAGQNTGSFRAVPYERIRRRIRKASEQLREYKERYPSLVVLFDSSAQVPLFDFAVLGAMYGNTLLSVPIARDDDADTTLDPTTVFEHQSRYLTRTSNTTVSAVAILQYVRPHNPWSTP